MNPNELSTVIAEAIRRKGSNPTRAAREVGLHVNSLRYILEGRSPSARRLAEACDALDLEFYVGPRRADPSGPVSAQRLADELERLAWEARRLSLRDEEEEPELPYVSAPRYEVLAAAGSGAEVVDETVKEFLAFNREWVRDQRLEASSLAVIDVQGDSMEPTLHDGDSVLLDMRPPDLRDGSIYTLRRDSELLVKRLRRQGSNWLIVSDNVAYPVEPLDAAVHVVGRVVWVGRTLP